MEFEQQAFVELLSEDGLIILARWVEGFQHSLTSTAPFCRGLGLDRLFLKFLKLYSDPHNLVLVLNCPTLLEVTDKDANRSLLRFQVWTGAGPACRL